MGLRSTCFFYVFQIITFYVDHSLYRHANNLRKSLQRGRKLKANGSCWMFGSRNRRSIEKKMQLRTPSPPPCRKFLATPLEAGKLAAPHRPSVWSQFELWSFTNRITVYIQAANVDVCDFSLASWLFRHVTHGDNFLLSLCGLSWIKWTTMSMSYIHYTMAYTVSVLYSFVIFWHTILEDSTTGAESASDTTFST